MDNIDFRKIATDLALACHAYTSMTLNPDQIGEMEVNVKTIVEQNPLVNEIIIDENTTCDNMWMLMWQYLSMPLRNLQRGGQQLHDIYNYFTSIALSTRKIVMYMEKPSVVPSASYKMPEQIARLLKVLQEIGYPTVTKFPDRVVTIRFLEDQHAWARKYTRLIKAGMINGATYFTVEPPPYGEDDYIRRMENYK